MEKLMLPNLESLHIKYGNMLLYGGSQQNYASIRRRLSGCGPTTASNMLIYLSKTHKNMESIFPYTLINFDTVLKMMNTIWKFVTPGIMGVNTLSIFADGAQKYLNKLGLSLHAASLEVSSNSKERVSQEIVKEFLIDRIANSFPVAFLNLHAGGLPNLDSWHWTLIVEIEYDENNLFAIIYDEGGRKKINLGLWLENTKKDGGFVSLDAI